MERRGGEVESSLHFTERTRENPAPHYDWECAMIIRLGRATMKFRVSFGGPLRVATAEIGEEGSKIVAIVARVLNREQGVRPNWASDLFWRHEETIHNVIAFERLFDLGTDGRVPVHIYEIKLNGYLQKPEVLYSYKERR
jgi:hypothetical protein